MLKVMLGEAVPALYGLIPQQPLALPSYTDTVCTKIKFCLTSADC